MKTVLLVCPTMWDESELRHAGAGYRVIPYGTDVSEHPERFDALGFIDEVLAAFRGQHLDGVVASDDYPGSIVAAALARARGLPGPAPEAILRCQHKYYSRLAQRHAAPEAVPPFALLDPATLDGAAARLDFPLFVKPVKSFFSVLAERVEDADALRDLAARAAPHLNGFVRPFNQLLARYTDFEHDGGHLLAEQPLAGTQVTLEGYVHRGRVHVLGVTDSVMYPGTISFARFEYPSTLPPAALARMGAIAARVMPEVGFDDALFNIEFFHDPASSAVHIIEINPRMCPQFADLMEKVNGVNTYDIALALATGGEPVPRRADAPFRVAASFVLRRFEDALVTRVPSEDDLAALLAELPDARVKVLCRVGARLSDELQDGKSYRYAVVNLGGADRADLEARYRAALRHLPFGFAPVPA